MNLSLEIKLAESYKSPSQKVRVMTEHWVDSQIYCPNCGYLNIDRFRSNRPVADFLCPNCKEEYELKSKKESIGNRIVNGAYQTMIERLLSDNNPNLFLLNYSLASLEVKDFLVVPKHFFVPEIIEKRKPLSHNARRAEWVGCNILIKNIPSSGKIYFVRNYLVETKDKVIKEWNKTLFLREEKDVKMKGWLLDVMNCIEKLEKKDFQLNEIYTFTDALEQKHPTNKHIQEKIRQQLQLLRNKGYLEFLGRGRYRLV